MQRPLVFWMGIGLLALGVIFFAATLFEINFWEICWPAVLIGIGVWILFQPRIERALGPTRLVLIGDVRYDRADTKIPQDIILLIGDTHLTFNSENLPDGETRVRVYGFVGDVTAMIPSGVGVAAASSAFVSDVEFFKKKHERILSPVELVSDQFQSSQKKVRIETFYFVSDLNILQT